MRRALLILLTLAVAGSALAATPAPPKPKPKPAPAAPIDAQSYVLPPLLPLAASRPGGDAGQCRASCAKAYYFCGAEGDDGGCGGRWAQCNSSCNATYVAPRFVGR